MTSADPAVMRVALGLAKRGLGRTGPNPTVGCVILDAQRRVVGQARTADSGRPHAETLALAQAGDRARGGTAVITLEPCAHQGETGPCANALIAAGIARAVVATTDPDPRTAGAGIARLRAAGIDVSTSIMETEARHLNTGFIKRITQGLPHLSLKLGLSLDGKIALANGVSQWITSPAARQRGHLLRAQSDVLLTGAKTVLKDEPRFTVRLPGLSGVADPAVGVVYDSARSNQEIVGWVREHRPHWRLLPGWNFETHLRTLAAEGCNRVLAEAGGGVARALLAENLVDEIVVFRAGVVLGGDARNGIGLFGYTKLEQALRFERVDVLGVGEDVMEVWRRA